MTEACDRYKVHGIVKYIKQYNFCFDTEQVEENIYDVLSHFGIYDVFTPKEENLIYEELYRLAEQFEFSEMVLLERDSILN